jgi:hypothetical protein
MPDNRHELFGVAAIMNGEVRGQTHSQSVFAQKPRPDAVKGSRPRQRNELTVAGIKQRAKHSPSPTLELHGRTPAEGQQQQTIGICAFAHEMRDTMGERIRLSRTRTGDDKERCRLGVPLAVYRCAALRLVERRKGVDFHSGATNAFRHQRRQERSFDDSTRGVNGASDLVRYCVRGGSR